MPLPEGWTGVFFDEEISGVSIFDEEPAGFADFLEEVDPDQACRTMANGCFDLHWNKEHNRGVLYEKVGKKRWPIRPFGCIAAIVEVTREMVRSGCEERAVFRGASNSMACLFGGWITYVPGNPGNKNG